MKVAHYISQSYRLKHYKYVKTRYGEIPKYLNLQNRNKAAKRIIKFRLSLTYFNALRMKYKNSDIPTGKCKFCDSLEDEIHVLLSCPKYQTERRTLLQTFNISDNRDSTDKFKRILNPINDREFAAVSLFIKKVFAARDNI